jgi:hypothetical protein
VNKQLSCVRAGMWAHHCFGRSMDWQASYLDLVARLGVDHNDLLPTAGPENSSLGPECGHFQFSRELTKMVPNSTHRQYILFEKKWEQVITVRCNGEEKGKVVVPSLYCGC